ncbi:MAG: PKD domain-containing protein [Flavobacteriales bacterium]
MRFLLVFISLYFIPWKSLAQGGGVTCSQMEPICTNSGLNFIANEGGPNASTIDPGNNYGCLITSPNPSWFYLEISQPGDIIMNLSAPEDIDFIIWGPYPNLAAAIANCGNHTNIVPNSDCVGFPPFEICSAFGCSFSGSNVETPGIPNAQVGQVYVMLVTNYADQIQPISLTQTGGTGATNCALLCNISNVTANPGACDNVTNTYNLSGTITFTNPPTTGTLTVTNSNGGSQTFNAPFTSPLNYSIAGITSSGGAQTVNVVFSGQTDCVFNANYTAPNPCSPGVCSVTAGSNSPVCSGLAINLTATTTAGAAYAWTGPNGYTSALQNPIINASTTAMSGDYTVTMTLPNGCVATSTVNVVVNQTPSAPTALSNSPVCEGNNIDLTAENITNATYNWMGPGITPALASLQNPSIANATIAMSGLYQVTATVNGCTSAAGTVTVEVFAVPTEPVISANFNPICTGQDLVLSITSPLLPPQGVVYTWTGPNGFTSSAASPTISNINLNQSGNYTVFFDLGGCISPVGSLAIAVSEAPSVDAGPDVQLCSNTPIDLGFAGEPGVTYSWSPTNFLSDPNISNPTITPINTGTTSTSTTYTLTAQQNGCSISDQVVVTVTPIPVATFSVPPGQCFANNSFGFVAGGDLPASATYQWNFGPSANTPASTQRNPAGISFSSTGNQSVTLVVSNNGCVSQPFTANVQVFAMPVANFIADVYEGCNPMRVNFTNLSESPMGILTFNWNFGNDKFSTATNPQVIYDEAGTFTVSLLATTAQGCSDRFTVNGLINVNKAPRAAFNTDPFGETTIVDPTIFLLDFSSNASEGFYVLSNGDIIEELNGTYTFTDTGLYTITQIVRNEFGCADTTSKEFRFELGFKIYIPNSFTPNNDGKNDIFRVYGEDIYDFRMIIYSRWGQILYTSFDMENGWDGRTALSDRILQQDTYIYHIEATDRLGKKVSFQGPVFLIK